MISDPCKPWTHIPRCEIGACKGTAHRACIVCGRRCCRWHRYGADHHFHCVECPAALYLEALRTAWDAEREVRCRRCGILWPYTLSVSHPGVRLFRPGCACVGG